MSQILDATQTWLVPHEIVFSVSRFEPAGAQLELVFGGSVTRFKFFKFGLRKTKFFNLSYVAELPSAGLMELMFLSVFYITFIKSINREYFLNCFLKTNFLKVYIKNNKKLL